MKIAVLIARLLLGLAFTFFGLNSFLHFLPDQLPPGDAGTMMTLMIHYGWAMFLGAIYLVAGALLLGFLAGSGRETGSGAFSVAGAFFGSGAGGEGAGGSGSAAGGGG